MSRISMGSSQSSIQQIAAKRRDEVSSPVAGRSQMKADFEKAAVAAGVDPSKLKDLEAQIQAGLMKSRTSPGSGFSLGAAMDDALKTFGGNLDTFHAEMQKLHDQRHQQAHTPATSAAKTSTLAGKLDISA